MITRSTRSVTDGAVTPPTPPSPSPSAGPAAEPGPASPDAGDGVGYPDPVEGLLHTAAAHRPLADVAHLVALLEESEEGGPAAADVLRALGTDRPVEDVARLVAVLSRPPYSPDHADRMIHAAAEHRPVEEVSRLMTLLYREPLEPHCGDEAVRAAATRRPVEELVELVERLARHRPAPAHPAADPGPPDGPAVPEDADGLADAEPDPYEASLAADGLPPRAPRRSARSVRPGRAHRERGVRRDPGGAASWTVRGAAVVLALCGLAHVPLHRAGVPTAALAVAVALSALCVLLAVGLTRRAALPLLVAGVLVPSVLAAAQVSAGRVDVTGLLPLSESTLVPPWIAGPLAVAAALTTAAALLVTLLGGRHPRATGAAVRRSLAARPLD
ncbi:hypothetical protein ACIQPQ_34155 [Streptomyces sp. NPDC091281]|uniref:hypothetical protein n=1 Tax=Streptomyces sp. NPDC091281 TaxID=3365985 RepID=UPI00381FD3C2